MSDTPAPQLLRVFAEAGRSGNLAAVTLWPGPPPPALLAFGSMNAGALNDRALDGADTALTHCHAWPTAAGLMTRCRQFGRDIRFCGHGLLAIAWLWHERHGTTPPLLTTDRLGGTPIATRIAGSRAWLLLKRQEVIPAPLPPLQAPFPRSGLVAAAHSGPADGYRLLIYAPTTPLAALALDHAAIAAYDARALILTAAVEQPDHHYRLRYAAPQYRRLGEGDGEDRATGSAHAVAASYWAAQLDSDALIGLQTPPPAAFPDDAQPGGVVHSRIDGSALALGGELRLLGPL